jgi:hypothetical protein
MHKSATKCNETIGKWCKNKHGASKIIDTFETYQLPHLRLRPSERRVPGNSKLLPKNSECPLYILPTRLPTLSIVRLHLWAWCSNGFHKCRPLWIDTIGELYLCCTSGHWPQSSPKEHVPPQVSQHTGERCNIWMSLWVLAIPKKHTKSRGPDPPPLQGSDCTPW